MSRSLLGSWWWWGGGVAEGGRRGRRHSSPRELGDGGRRSRWRADSMGLKGRGGECLLSPVAAGRLLTSLKLGTGRNRLVF